MTVAARNRTDIDFPNTWRIIVQGPDRRPVGATYVCPNGHYGSLLDHKIAADGTVSPSVVCPTNGCGFHDMVKLAGWEAA
jgi:hypothetical protein